MFGLSGSSSKSKSVGKSQSTSSSFGQSGSVQGSQSTSIGGGTSQSVQQSQSRVAFEDVFARLFSGAEAAAGALDPSLLTDASNQLFSGGLDFLSSIGGDAGTSFLTERLANAGTLEADQIAQLKADIGDLYSEELLPGITSEAVAGGQLGGGRQGVAEGIAAGKAADAFSRGAIDIRQRNQAQLDELAAGVAGRNLQGAQIGVQGLSPLAALAELGFGADFRSIQMLAEILGGPTVLTDSAGFSTAQDFAQSFSDSFGVSSSMDRSQSQSTSETRSKSKSTSAGIGFGG